MEDSINYYDPKAWQSCRQRIVCFVEIIRETSNPKALHNNKKSINLFPIITLVSEVSTQS